MADGLSVSTASVDGLYIVDLRALDLDEVEGALIGKAIQAAVLTTLAALDHDQSSRSAERIGGLEVMGFRGE